jgi:glutamate-1-semialdehyde aminotransferase
VKKIGKKGINMSERSKTLHNTGAELWRKAKTIIPGGNQLLSKRAERFLPEFWPSYYKKATGVEVWDLDDRHYFDLSIMAIGACVLGYANPAVNEAVKRAIDAGSMCTLNCYEEVEVAEKLIELHPWAGMVRFARTGGEACAIAVRIARAASGKDKVAFCGYHGWHDWYLSSNLADSHNLDQLLVPGLKPLGVPRALKNTAIPFRYGKTEELNDIVTGNSGEIGVIMMEVERHQLNLGFLRDVRKVATKIGAVLIYDEITSGFRMRPGGLHMLYGLEPDIVTLGKAMGNGFPIAAVAGKTDVMKTAQDTFISSTYWTERTGFAAALEVIRQFETHGAAESLKEIGNYLIKNLRQIIAAKGLKIEIADLIPAAPILNVKEENASAVNTLFTQEMLKRGFLASEVIYMATAHTKEIINRYLASAEEVFDIMKKGIQSGNLESLLEGPVRYEGLRRLDQP